MKALALLMVICCSCALVQEDETEKYNRLAEERDARIAAEKTAEAKNVEAHNAQVQAENERYIKEHPDLYAVNQICDQLHYLKVLNKKMARERAIEAEGGVANYTARRELALQIVETKEKLEAAKANFKKVVGRPFKQSEWECAAREERTW